MKVHFETELDALKSLVTELGASVEQAVRDAVRAVETHDIALARRIVENDESIDRSEVHIEEECLKIMALYQPVAGDLRYVITLLKVNNELERIGDLAVNIADRELAATSHPQLENAPDLPVMFREVRRMLKEALDALVCRDSLRALEVIRHDDIVDQLHKENYGRIADGILHDPSTIGAWLDQLTISRSLERIADCATNIAEDVIYLEQGRIIRHAPQTEKLEK